MLIENSLHTKEGYYGYHYRSISKVKSKHVWYDLRVHNSNKNETTTLLDYLRQSSIYNGFIFDIKDVENHCRQLSNNSQIILPVSSPEEIKLAEHFFASNSSHQNFILLGDDHSLLNNVTLECKKAFKIHISNNEELLYAIKIAPSVDYLILSFTDTTNIPLELVIASLQNKSTILLKEINHHIPEDSIISLGVMEEGADGIVFSPKSYDHISKFITTFTQKKAINIPLQTCIVRKVESIGSGHRGCVDLVTLFSPSEGLLIGSTSQGGILCCPEVFELPYMELRPFRVNAGGIHSYIYQSNGTTAYMSELKAGAQVSIVSTNGECREAPVGRIKIEVRPMRLIEAEFSTGELVNVIMQDDWHVRVFSPEGNPININEIKPGDQLLGYVCEPGRHVGIKVNENIVET